VIEVNDNPSIDAGVEDTVLKDGLYVAIMEAFVRRIESFRGLTRREREARSAGAAAVTSRAATNGVGSSDSPPTQPQGATEAEPPRTMHEER
jgi:hypothetical protein